MLPTGALNELIDGLGFKGLGVLWNKRSESLITYT